jgi:hypothetical protein
MVTYRPSPLLVAESWVESLPVMTGIDCATARPDPSTWATDLFVVVSQIAAPSTVPIRTPIMQISCFAQPSTTKSNKPQWNLASDLAEAIAEAAQTQTNPRVTITATGNFYPIQVKSVQLISGPLKGVSESNMAVYTLDVRIGYIPVLPVTV